MRIVVTSSGADLEAQASPLFGRCPMYVFVDTDTLAFEALDNPAQAAPGGAGVRAAQFVVEQGAQAVISGNVGPNAYDVLNSAGVPVYLFTAGSVRQAVEAFQQGRLSLAAGATAAEKAGMPMGRGRGLGRSPRGR